MMDAMFATVIGYSLLVFLVNVIFNNISYRSRTVLFDVFTYLHIQFGRQFLVIFTCNRNVVIIVIIWMLIVNCVIFHFLFILFRYCNVLSGILYSVVLVFVFDDCFCCFVDFVVSCCCLF